MTKEDVIKILAMIEATYPSYKVQDRASTIEAWAVALEPYKAETIRDALLTYIRTNPSKFAPSIAELIGITKRFDPANDIGTEEHIAHIRKAISNSNYNSKREFAMLDRIEQRAVGSPENLRSYAMLDTDELETVIMSHLRRSLSQANRTEVELSAMPESRRMLIEGTVNRLENKTLSSNNRKQLESVEVIDLGAEEIINLLPFETDQTTDENGDGDEYVLSRIQKTQPLKETDNE